MTELLMDADVDAPWNQSNQTQTVVEEGEVVEVE